MKEGMPWDWESHPEFMDSIERTPKGVNITFTLGPLMMYVMGKEAAKSRKCNEEKEICRLLKSMSWFARLPKTKFGTTRL